MNDVTHLFHETIKNQWAHKNVEVVKVIPLPLQGDTPMKVKTIREILEELESPIQLDTLEYIVQVRPKVNPPRPVHPAESAAPKPSLDGIYLPNGRLNVPFLMKNADILFDAGEFALARKIYKTILQSGECTASALYRLGRCYESEGKMDEAIAKYEESIVFHPNIESYQRLATLLAKQNKPQQSAEVLERVKVLKDTSGSGEGGGQTWARHGVSSGAAQSSRVTSPKLRIHG